MGKFVAAKESEILKMSQIQGRLQEPEGPYDFHQLSVTQGDILRSQRVVTGGNDVLPVQMGLFFCSAPHRKWTVYKGVTC